MNGTEILLVAGLVVLAIGMVLLYLANGVAKHTKHHSHH